MSRRLPAAALVFFAFILWAPAAPLLAQDTDEANGLISTGEGVVRAAPDVAVLRVGAIAEAASAQQAQAQVNRTIEQAVAAIADLNVPRDRIQTQQVMLWPVYSNERPPRPLPADQSQQDQEPRIVGFRASSTLEVRVEDLSKTGDVLGAAVSAGANQIEGLSFELRDDTEQMQEALKQAIAHARAKAEAMAEAMGTGLGPVLEAREGGARIEPVRIGAARVMAAESAQMSVPVQPGEVAVRASVTLRYRLLPESE